MNTTEPAIVLLNPAAGQGRAEQLRRPMAQWLLQHAPGVPLLAPQSADAALATLMITANRTRVVLVGGDGTVQAMLPAFLRCGHRLGLVPAGRQNRLAQALGLAQVAAQRGWQQALAYALKGRTSPIDVAQLQTDTFTVPFACSMAAGWEAAAVQRMAAAPRWLPRAAHPWWGALGSRPHTRPTEARVWLDGRLEHEGRLLTTRLRNAPVLGTSDVPERMDDGRLAAEVIEAAGPWRRAGLLHAESAASRRWHGQQVRVDAHQPLPLLVDGEPQPASAHFTVQMLPRAVHAAGLHGLAPRPQTPPR